MRALPDDCVLLLLLVLTLPDRSGTKLGASAGEKIDEQVWGTSAQGR
jgi:hypothetical protein